MHTAKYLIEIEKPKDNLAISTPHRAVMHTRLIRIIAEVFSLISSSALWAASYTLPAALGTALFASCSLSAGST